MQVGHPPAEATSPELALVDSRLASRAREGLHVPGDTLARLERDISLRRLTSREVLDLDHSFSAEPSLRRALAVRTIPVRRRPKLLAAGSTAGALVAALLLGVQIDLRGTPADADTVTEPPTVALGGHELHTSTADASTPKISTQPVDRVKARKPQPRRFAWAPASGASGYHVEFFRGASRIYSAGTAVPQVDLPQVWEFRGRSERLRPGVYRWYVWPVESGRRQSRATVQAELVVG